MTAKLNPRKDTAPSLFTSGIDAPSDSYDPSKSRKGVQPDPIAVALHKIGEKKP
jgi:hypothetical protein